MFLLHSLVSWKAVLYGGLQDGELDVAKYADELGMASSGYGTGKRPVIRLEIASQIG